MSFARGLCGFLIRGHGICGDGLTENFLDLTDAEQLETFDLLKATINAVKNVKKRRGLGVLY